MNEAAVSPRPLRMLPRVVVRYIKGQSQERVLIYIPAVLFLKMTIPISLPYTRKIPVHSIPSSRLYSIPEAEERLNLLFLRVLPFSSESVAAAATSGSSISAMALGTADGNCIKGNAIPVKMPNRPMALLSDIPESRNCMGISTDSILCKILSSSLFIARGAEKLKIFLNCFLKPEILPKFFLSRNIETIQYIMEAASPMTRPHTAAAGVTVPVLLRDIQESMYTAITRVTCSVSWETEGVTAFWIP